MKMSENTNIYCNVNALTYSPGAGEFQGFTPEQIKLFRDAFAIFDTSRTGCITSQDLTAVMRNLGQNPSEKKMRSVIPDETLKEAFQVFDKDGNGFISLDELRHVMSCLGVVLSKTEVQKMMDEADLDRDGMLNYKEFAAMMN